MKNKRTTTFKETKSDSDIADIVQLSDQGFKLTMINMLRHLTEDVDNM